MTNWNTVLLLVLAAVIVAGVIIAGLLISAHAQLEETNLTAYVHFINRLT
jgi:type II secretory pathway component PulK